MDSMDMSLSNLGVGGKQGVWVIWELVVNREAWHVAVHGVAKSWTRVSELIDWLMLYVKVKKVNPSIQYLEMS